MKLTVRRLARARHGLAAVVLQGVAGTAAGLYQANVAVTLGGIMAILLGVAALTATYLVDRPARGELFIVVPQQPQLPGVRAHAAHTTELAKVL